MRVGTCGFVGAAAPAERNWQHCKVGSTQRLQWRKLINNNPRMDLLNAPEHAPGVARGWMSPDVHCDRRFTSPAQKPHAPPQIDLKFACMTFIPS